MVYTVMSLWIFPGFCGKWSFVSFCNCVQFCVSFIPSFDWSWMSPRLSCHAFHDHYYFLCTSKSSLAAASNETCSCTICSKLFVVQALFYSARALKDKFLSHHVTLLSEELEENGWYTVSHHNKAAQCIKFNLQNDVLTSWVSWEWEFDRCDKIRPKNPRR